MADLSPAGLDLRARIQNVFGRENVVETSTTRSAARNASIRGASNTSQHLTGDAIDFKVRDGKRGFLPLSEVKRRSLESVGPFGQLISETGAGMGPRTHLSVGSKGQVLSASDANVARYGRRYVVEATNRAGVYRENINKVLGGTIGNKVADVLKGGATGIAKAGDAITSATSFVQQYLTRGAFGIIGIILIIGAVIILTKGKIR